MIKISRLADYGTVILSHLASFAEQKQSAAQIAHGTQLPTPTVSKLLKKLNEAALVSSSRGATGGYQLSRSAQKISLAEIIDAIDGPLAMTECSKGDANCSRSTLCALRHNWQSINQMIVGLLRQLSLSDMNRPLNKLISIQQLDDMNHGK